MARFIIYSYYLLAFFITISKNAGAYCDCQQTGNRLSNEEPPKCSHSFEALELQEAPASRDSIYREAFAQLREDIVQYDFDGIAGNKLLPRISGNYLFMLWPIKREEKIEVLQEIYYDIESKLRKPDQSLVEALLGIVGKRLYAKKSLKGNKLMRKEAQKALESFKAVKKQLPSWKLTNELKAHPLLALRSLIKIAVQEIAPKTLDLAVFNSISMCSSPPKKMRGIVAENKEAFETGNKVATGVLYVGFIVIRALIPPVLPGAFIFSSVISTLCFAAIPQFFIELGKRTLKFLKVWAKKKLFELTIPKHAENIIPLSKKEIKLLYTQDAPSLLMLAFQLEPDSIDTVNSISFPLTFSAKVFVYSKALIKQKFEILKYDEATFSAYKIEKKARQIQAVDWLIQNSIKFHLPAFAALFAKQIYLLCKAIIGQFHKEKVALNAMHPNDTKKISSFFKGVKWSIYGSLFNKASVKLFKDLLKKSCKQIIFGATKIGLLLSTKNLGVPLLPDISKKTNLQSFFKKAFKIKKKDLFSPNFQRALLRKKLTKATNLIKEGSKQIFKQVIELVDAHRIFLSQVCKVSKQHGCVGIDQDANSGMEIQSLQERIIISAILASHEILNTASTTKMDKKDFILHSVSNLKSSLEKLDNSLNIQTQGSMGKIDSNPLSAFSFYQLFTKNKIDKSTQKIKAFSTKAKEKLFKIFFTIMAVDSIATVKELLLILASLDKGLGKITNNLLEVLDKLPNHFSLNGYQTAFLGALEQAKPTKFELKNCVALYKILYHLNFMYKQQTENDFLSVDAIVNNPKREKNFENIEKEQKRASQSNSYLVLSNSKGKIFEFIPRKGQLAKITEDKTFEIGTKLYLAKSLGKDNKLLEIFRNSQDEQAPSSTDKNKDSGKRIILKGKMKLHKDRFEESVTLATQGILWSTKKFSHYDAELISALITKAQTSYYPKQKRDQFYKRCTPQDLNSVLIYFDKKETNTSETINKHAAITRVLAKDVSHKILDIKKQLKFYENITPLYYLMQKYRKFISHSRAGIALLVRLRENFFEASNGIKHKQGSKETEKQNLYDKAARLAVKKIAVASYNVTQLSGEEEKVLDTIFESLKKSKRARTWREYFGKAKLDQHLSIENRLKTKILKSLKAAKKTAISKLPSYSPVRLNLRRYLRKLNLHESFLISLFLKHLPEEPTGNLLSQKELQVYISLINFLKDYIGTLKDKEIYTIADFMKTMPRNLEDSQTIISALLDSRIKDISHSLSKGQTADELSLYDRACAGKMAETSEATMHVWIEYLGMLQQIIEENRRRFHITNELVSAVKQRAKSTREYDDLAMLDATELEIIARTHSEFKVEISTLNKKFRDALKQDKLSILAQIDQPDAKDTLIGLNKSKLYDLEELKKGLFHLRVNGYMAFRATIGDIIRAYPLARLETHTEPADIMEMLHFWNELKVIPRKSRQKYYYQYLQLFNGLYALDFELMQSARMKDSIQKQCSREAKVFPMSNLIPQYISKSLKAIHQLKKKFFNHGISLFKYNSTHLLENLRAKVFQEVLKHDILIENVRNIGTFKVFQDKILLVIDKAMIEEYLYLHKKNSSRLEKFWKKKGTVLHIKRNMSEVCNELYPPELIEIIKKKDQPLYQKMRKQQNKTLNDTGLRETTYLLENDGLNDEYLWEKVLKYKAYSYRQEYKNVKANSQINDPWPTIVGNPFQSAVHLIKVMVEGIGIYEKKRYEAMRYCL